MVYQARNGLRARKIGSWTLEKLTYVEKYAKAFMVAMDPKRRTGKWKNLIYMDLLSGPGKCIDENQNEYDGSPLRAIRIKPPFDKLYFSDKNSRNIKDLEKRINSKDTSRVEIIPGDCNFVVKDIAKKIPPKTLGLIFLDPEGFEVKFEIFRVLKNLSVDILYLFPSGIGIKRNLKFFANQPNSRMDDFMGGKNWREFPKAKIAQGVLPSAEDMKNIAKPWVNLFRENIRDIGFIYQDQSDPEFVNQKNTEMYQLLFFSKHPAGLRIWKNIKKLEPSGQRKLPL